MISKTIQIAFSFLLVISFAVPGWAEKLTIEQIQDQMADVSLLLGMIDDITENVSISESLYRYQSAYERYIRKFKGRVSSVDHMQKKLADSRLVLFGDDHANPMSQERVGWLLEQMVESDAPVVLFIEWIERRFQGHIDDFMEGKISAEKLRELVRFDDYWGFQWESHINILERAKELRVRVIAGENIGNVDRTRPNPIRSRDNLVSARIAKHMRENPEDRVLAVWGEYHIAGTRADGKGHLKGKLKAQGFAPDIVIYPNSNGEYWRLLKRHKDTDKVEVIKFSDTDYYLNQGQVQKYFAAIEHAAEMSLDKDLAELNMSIVRGALRSINPNCKDILDPKEWWNN